MKNSMKWLARILYFIADSLYPTYKKRHWYDGYENGVNAVRERYTNEINLLHRTVEKYKKIPVNTLINRRAQSKMTKRRLLRELELRPETKCLYCKINRADTIDHVIPLCRNGTWEKANIVPCCLECNQKKGDKTLEEFLS